jgi:hypothetical protein
VRAAHSSRVGLIVTAAVDLVTCGSPATSPLISARWRLIWTTSESILGKTRPAPFRPVGGIYQIIDLATRRARNEETLRPVPFLPAIPEAIEGALRTTCLFFRVTSVDVTRWWGSNAPQRV